MLAGRAFGAAALTPGSRAVVVDQGFVDQMLQRWNPIGSRFMGFAVSERRSFALLRPIVDAAAQDRLRDAILNAYLEHEAAVAEASA